MIEQRHVLHFMIKCQCGNILSQCRCFHSDKPIKLVDSCYKCATCMTPIPAKLEQVLTGAANMELRRPTECTPEQARFDLGVLLQYIAPGIPEVDEIRDRWAPSR